MWEGGSLEFERLEFRILPLITGSVLWFILNWIPGLVLPWCLFTLSNPTPLLAILSLASVLALTFSRSQLFILSMMEVPSLSIIIDCAFVPICWPELRITFSLLSRMNLAHYYILTLTTVLGTSDCIVPETHCWKDEYLTLETPYRDIKQ